MAILPLCKLRLIIFSAGLSLCLLGANTPDALAADGNSFKILREGSELAHCLNKQSTSVSFESQTTSNGVVQESTQITRYSATDESDRIQDCVQSAHTCQKSNIFLPLAIRARELDTHSAWDPSDRMRLTDLIVQSLTEKAQGSGHFVTANEEDATDYRLALLGRTSQTPDLILDTQIHYFGTLISTEGLNEWLAPSHTALLEMRLMNRLSGRVYAERQIKIKLPLSLRTRDTSGGTDRRWLNLVQHMVEAQGTEMLEGFRCAPLLLTAQAISENQVIIQLRGVRGLSPGQGILLMPQHQMSSRNTLSDSKNWPIVRVSSLDDLRAKGDLISGSNDACRAGDCVAIPL
jgi:hypothetical protein